MAAHIQAGADIPDVVVFEDIKNPTSLRALVGDKKAVAFGVPGAFTPGCHNQLGQFVTYYDEVKKKGFEEIYCISVNDSFVMQAWGESQSAIGKIHMVADPQGALTQAVGMQIDRPPLGGLRSKRYILTFEGGKVTHVIVEPDDTGLSCTRPDAFLATF